MFEILIKGNQITYDPEFRFKIYVDGSEGKELVFTLPLGNYEALYNFTVNWGDGSKNTVTQRNSENRVHTYAAAGEYIVSLRGICEEFCLEANSEKLKIISVLNWGDVNLKKINFRGCENLNYIAKDNKYSFKDLIDASCLFYGCLKLTAIPEGFFRIIPNVENLTSAFAYNNIGVFPEDFISDAPSLKLAIGMLNYNYKLNCAIPKYLFKNSPNITKAYALFYASTFKGEIPQDLLKNCYGITDFKDMFTYNTKLTGSSIHFWDNAFRPVPPYSQPLSFSKCYLNCSGLSDYQSIPAEWK